MGVLFVGTSVPGQELFSSGSTGADGALQFFAPPEARAGHAMAYDRARQRVVLFGGGDTGVGNSRLFDVRTWEWNGQRWTARVTKLAPPARRDHAMVYDSERGVVVLFAGSGFGNSPFDEPLNDTWEYDGVNWAQRIPKASPPPRKNMGMAYDSARRRTVMVGGENLNDAWEWDGNTWAQIDDVPESHDTFAMAYDTQRRVSVVFGSTVFGTSVRAGIFEWNGENWTSAEGLGRILPAVSYDTVGERVLAFGGQGTGAVVTTGDLFAWDGQSLSELAAAPPPRRHAAMVFDEARGESLLFGGGAGVENRFRVINDTWLFDGQEWERPLFTQSDPVIDMSEKPDGVWNYTAIDIAAGVEVSFLKNSANTPVVWLSTGDVNIRGIVDLDGEIGSPDPTPGNEPSGGPGGFDGGLGGSRFDQSGTFAGNPGQGPGGGEAGVNSGEPGGPASHATEGVRAGAGPTYGNVFVDPLVGGSGGGGNASTTNGDGHSGGGGGGAILIASSTSIRVDGELRADGGAPFQQNNGGSGGAIRLAANRVEGSGVLRAIGQSGWGGLGRIRIESFITDLTQQPNPRAVFAPPLTLRLGERPRISITGVAGQPVPQPPSGSSVAPDVTFSETGEIQVALETTNVPTGTVLTVRITVQGEVITVESSPTDASGKATAQATVPAGVGTIQAFADFQDPLE
jgi:hypothetical protein